MTFHSAAWLIPVVKNQDLSPSCTGMIEETWFVRSLFFLSQELAAPADLGPCSVTSFSATPCSGKTVLIKAVGWKVEY